LGSVKFIQKFEWRHPDGGRRIRQRVEKYGKQFLTTILFCFKNGTVTVKVGSVFCWC